MALNSYYALYRPNLYCIYTFQHAPLKLRPYGALGLQISYYNNNNIIIIIIIIHVFYEAHHGIGM